MSVKHDARGDAEVLKHQRAKVPVFSPEAPPPFQKPRDNRDAGVEKAEYCTMTGTAPRLIYSAVSDPCRIAARL
jgi:hypothetical protein